VSIRLVSNTYVEADEVLSGDFLNRGRIAGRGAAVGMITAVSQHRTHARGDAAWLVLRLREFRETDLPLALEFLGRKARIGGDIGHDCERGCEISLENFEIESSGFTVCASI
jgi:hypothetical protein